MQERLIAFAREFDEQSGHSFGEEQKSIHHPLIYVFLGDGCKAALEAVHRMNEKKWKNSDGVVYLHVCSGETVPLHNVYRLPLPSNGACGRKDARKEMADRLRADTDWLIELNRSVRQAGVRIAEFGRLYASLQQLNIAVVAAADDPCNVMIQEITLLLKQVLSESFRQIHMDLYVLLRERAEEYSICLGVSFLKELESYQGREYQFEAPLQVTADHIRLTVRHQQGPLFDLVYLFSDKNEKGLYHSDSIHANCRVICSLSVLKNRRVAEEDQKLQGTAAYQPYNNQDYIRNIRSTPASGNVYSTAGYSRVERPNRAIALSALSVLYKHMADKLTEAAQQDRRSVLEICGLEGASIEKRLDELMPAHVRLEDMHSLQFQEIPLKQLMDLTLSQAEEQLYGSSAGIFFQQNFAEAAKRLLAGQPDEEEMRRTIWENIVQNPRYGIYCAWLWTSEQENSVLYQALHTQVRNTWKDMEDCRMRLEQLLQETVGIQNFSTGSFFQKKNVRHYVRYHIRTIYGQRLDILRLELRLVLLQRLESALAGIHQEVNRRYEDMLAVGREISEACRVSISEAHDYLGRNIPEYYGAVVARILKDIEAKRGPHFLFEERFLGDLAGSLEHGGQDLLERLAEVCRRDVLSTAPFKQSFEEELLERANVRVAYREQSEEGAGVLSKDDLYRDLYQSLQEQAALHLDTYSYTRKHRYEERYYFGDANSEFIRYALASDRGSPYKLGCIHERQTSGIEKLNLMGGFGMEDVLYYRNGLKYYEHYAASGYQFHGGEGRLPAGGREGPDCTNES